MKGKVLRALAIIAFALIMVGVVTSVDWPEGGMDETTSEDVGRTLFGASDSEGYGLILVLIGILLLVALLGGVFLAKEEVDR